MASEPNGNLVTIVPSFGVNGFTNRGLFDPLVGLTGLESKTTRWARRSTPGSKSASPTARRLWLGFAGVASDEQNIQLLGGLAIPF